MRSCKPTLPSAPNPYFVTTRLLMLLFMLTAIVRSTVAQTNPNNPVQTTEPSSDLSGTGTLHITFRDVETGLRIDHVT